MTTTSPQLPVPCLMVMPPPSEDDVGTELNSSP
jgi:hypothetical protein